MIDDCGCDGVDTKEIDPDWAVIQYCELLVNVGTCDELGGLTACEIQSVSAKKASSGKETSQLLASSACETLGAMILAAGTLRVNCVRSKLLGLVRDTSSLLWDDALKALT